MRKGLEKNNILIHNNPVSDRLIISGFGQDMNESQVAIYSLDGSQVVSTLFDVRNNKVDLDVAQLQSGVYFLRLEVPNLQTIRFVKL